jgi:hypothetical protein
MSVPAVHAPLDKYRGFVLAMSIGFALIYAELAAFMHATVHALPDGEAWPLIAAVYVIALAGHLGSFLPARAYTVPGSVRQGSLILPELTAQLARGMGIVLAAALACGGLTLYIAGFDQTAAYSILNNTYVFALAGGVFMHALVAYVRYGALLYAVKQDSFVKVMVISGLIAAIIIGSFVFLIQLDIAWLNTAPPALHGLYGLHVYGRDLFMFTLMMAAYGWHLRWMADH